MSLRPRTIVLLTIATIAAFACARLGVWQIQRLNERRAFNALLLSRMLEPVVPIAQLPADTGAGHYRTVLAHGTLEYPREFAWAARMRQESPGVNLLTPMRVEGLEGLLVVDRGWVYSPDARTVDLARWRESDTATVRGYVETWTAFCGAAAAAIPVTCGDTALRILRRLDSTTASRLAGAPVAPYLLVQTSDSALRADSVPVRLNEPVLDEGPHFSYAVQWLGFAVIAAVGGVTLAIHDARR